MRKLILWTLALVVSGSSFAQGNNALEATASLKLLRSAVDSPFNQSQSVAECVMGTLITGTAITEGRLSLSLLPSEDRAVIDLRLDGVTTSHTLGVNIPRRNIAVNIYSTAYTRLAAIKRLSLLPEGIATAPAAASAWTSLEYEGIGVSAGGLFRHMKERIAYRRAWETALSTKAWNEARVSEQASRELSTMIDTKSERLLASLNKDYQAIFYKPYFLENGIPGTLHFSTTQNSLHAEIRPNVALPSAALSARPPLPVGDLTAQAYDGFVSRIIPKRLFGAVMNEEDLEEFLIQIGFPATFSHYKPGEEQMVMKLCDERPLRLSFAGGAVTATICTDWVKFRGETFPPLQLALRYAVSVEDGSLVGTRPRLSQDEAVEEALRRFARIFPETIRMGKLTLPGKEGPSKTLAVKSAAAENGWLTLGWELTP